MMRQIVRAWALWTSGSRTTTAGHIFNTTWRIHLTCGHWINHVGLLVATWMWCPDCAQLPPETRKFFGLDR